WRTMEFRKRVPNIEASLCLFEYIHQFEYLCLVKKRDAPLEQEQQELESLKSEFLLNSNELVDEREPEQGKQVEHTASIVDTSIAVESKINFSKQIENNQNSQVINTNSREENFDTTSASNNSKELRKVWIIGSTIGFFIFLGLIINGNGTNQTVSNIEQQISNTIPSETFKQDNSLETEEIIESSPKVSTRLQEQNFNNYDFPLDSCGDQDPDGANIWYPVYVDDTPENLSTIHNNYCQDAIRKYRKQEQFYSIQVASFINEFKAKKFAELMQINIGSGEVGESAVYNFDNTSNSLSSKNSSTNSNIASYDLNKSYEYINESESIALITRLYDLLSQKSFTEAELLYNPQLAYQFNSNFFSQFEKVTVENLRTTSISKNSITFIGENTYIWLDGSTQKESRSYKVENFNGYLKITASKFIKVTKFR
ncbi:MAG: hypothetical protein ACFCU7_13415, partial [Pleurocapsa sp.]